MQSLITIAGIKMEAMDKLRKAFRVQPILEPTTTAIHPRNSLIPKFSKRTGEI
jgi:hypothetical protein